MKTSPKLQEVVTALAVKHGLDLASPGAWLRLNMEGYDRLVIEVIHPNLVSVAHVYAPRPDVRLADPGIIFFAGYALWVPVEISQRVGGYRIYAFLSQELDEIVSVLPLEQADLAEFAEVWAENIVAQGWLEEATRYVEPEMPF
ncbi:MAG: hypothetical protein IT329_15925 [Caldilineaceae bacterium]|nr:hypothetical protein [Caldilineaceae bacterium]